MTRGDFDLIAKAVREAPLGELEEPARLMVADSLGDVLALSNARFDRARFVRACMGTD